MQSRAATVDVLPEAVAATLDARRARVEGWWKRRPLAARMVRAVVFLAPIAAALLISIGISQLLPGPSGLWSTVAWWVVITAGTACTLWVVERGVRRLIPLALLLNVTLLFPDRAPARFSVARSGGRAKDLEKRLREARDRGLQTEDLEVAGTVLELVAALTLHDRPTRGHSERVRIYTDLIAEDMKLPEEDRAKLRWASLLHDVGKLSVSAELLNKPGRPDEEEWVKLRRHPQEGARLVAPILPWLGPWALAIEHHHERWDGQGYPRGLRGDEISLGARIVAVADAYETMTAARPYRPAMSVPAAREELVRGSGSQFDPAVVRAFLNISVGRLWRTIGVWAWLSQFPLLATIGGGLIRVFGPQVGAGAVTAVTTVGLAVGGVIVPHHHDTAPDRPAVAVTSPSPSPSFRPTADPSTLPPSTQPPQTPPPSSQTPTPPTSTPVPPPVYPVFVPLATATAEPTPTPSPSPGAHNDAPVVTLGSAQSINEGTVMSTTGSFSDADSSSFAAVVDWGDGGRPQQLTLSGRGFTLRHMYADEGQYTVTVTVTDDGGASGSGRLEVAVGNPPPVVTLPAGATASAGAPMTATGRFADPGGDSWGPATVDYGDGSGPVPLPLRADKSFSLAHLYSPGTYTVRVTVTDDDGASGSATMTVLVT